MKSSNMPMLLGLLCAITVVTSQPRIRRADIIETRTNFLKTDRSLSTVQSERGKKMSRLIIPLAIILKFTTLVTATLTALKIFLVQSLVVSKLALFGVSILAFKTFYSNIQQLMHRKTSDYSYPQAYVSDWPVEAWTPELTPYSHLFSDGDLHSPPSIHARVAVAVPHVHNNDTALMRSDEIRSRPQPPSKPPTLAYETIVTKITESTSD